MIGTIIIIKLSTFIFVVIMKKYKYALEIIDVTIIVLVTVISYTVVYIITRTIIARGLLISSPRLVYIIAWPCIMCETVIVWQHIVFAAIVIILVYILFILVLYIFEPLDVSLCTLYMCCKACN